MYPLASRAVGFLTSSHLNSLPPRTFRRRQARTPRAVLVPFYQALCLARQLAQHLWACCTLGNRFPGVVSWNAHRSSHTKDYHPFHRGEEHSAGRWGELPWAVRLATGECQPGWGLGRLPFTCTARCVSTVALSPCDVDHWQGACPVITGPLPQSSGQHPKEPVTCW